MANEQQFALEVCLQLNSQPRKEVLDMLDRVRYAVELHCSRRTLLNRVSGGLVLLAELETVGSDLRELLKVILGVVAKVLSNLTLVHLVPLPFFEGLIILDAVEIGEEQ